MCRFFISRYGSVYNTQHAGTIWMITISKNDCMAYNTVKKAVKSFPKRTFSSPAQGIINSVRT